MFGGIDGHSRIPVMLQCAGKDKATTVVVCFLEGVNKFGLPSEIQTDQGCENVGIVVHMTSRRDRNRGRVTGKSRRNQRIERLWKDAYQGVLKIN